jgi:hypothetical protein
MLAVDIHDCLYACIGDVTVARTFIVNTDTCDRGGSHWLAFHFPLVGLAVFIISGQDKWSVRAKDI